MVQKRGLQVTKDGPAHFKCNAEAPEGDTQKKAWPESQIKDAPEDEARVQTLSAHESFIPENCLQDRDI